MSNKISKLVLFFMMMAVASQNCMAMIKIPENIIQPEQSMIDKLKQTAVRHKGKIIATVGILGTGALAYLSRGAIGNIAEAKKELIHVDAEIINRAGAKMETSADDGIQQEVVNNNKTSLESGQPINATNDETGHNQTSTTEANLNSTASIATSTEQTFRSKALTFIIENADTFVAIGAALLAVGARAQWLVERGTPSRFIYKDKPILFCAIGGAALALSPVAADYLVPKTSDKVVSSVDSQNTDAGKFATELHE